MKENQFAMGSSQDQLNTRNVDDLNKYLVESDKTIELNLDVHTINYKDNILETFKLIEDPFEREIKEMNFDQNPGEPN